MSLKPATDLIIKFEGYRSKAYLCPAKVWTIGYGTTVYPDGKKVSKGDVTNKEQALSYLEYDIIHDRIPAIRKCVTARLSLNMICALISFAYNVGNAALSKSTLVKKLNAGEPKEVVAQQFDKWVRGGGRVLPGLVKRREAEKTLFLA